MAQWGFEMVKKKKARRRAKTSRPPADEPTTYVRGRVAELAIEHGWDPAHVEDLVKKKD